MLVFFSFVFIAISVLMVLVVLVQRGRGGGLAGAFGGGGGSGSAFGTKTGDLFTVVTVVLFVLFLILAVSLNFSYRTRAPEIITKPTAADTSLDLSSLPGATSQPATTGPGVSIVGPSASSPVKNATTAPAVSVPPAVPTSAPAKK